MLNKTKIEVLEKLYFDKTKGFVSIVKLWAIAKKLNSDISLSDVKKYLSTIPSSVVYNPRP